MFCVSRVPQKQIFGIIIPKEGLQIYSRSRTNRSTPTNQFWSIDFHITVVLLLVIKKDKGYMKVNRPKSIGRGKKDWWNPNFFWYDNVSDLDRCVFAARDSVSWVTHSPLPQIIILFLHISLSLKKSSHFLCPIFGF